MQANANLERLKDADLDCVLRKAPDEPSHFSDWKKDTADTIRSPLTASLSEFTNRLKDAKDPRGALDAEEIDPTLVTDAHRLRLFSSEGVLEFLDVVAERRAYSFEDPMGALMRAEVNAWSPPTDVLMSGLVIEDSSDDTGVVPGAWGASNADKIAELQKAMWCLGIEPRHISIADYTVAELFQLNQHLDAMNDDVRSSYSAAIRQVFAQHGDSPIMVKTLLSDILSQLTDIDTTTFITRA